ncbi:MAG TPA: carboxylating nicotinate-nucleotide diphosphorylase [Bacteroidales bacterium]|nr:carboxylating nicotinate-nucleotide diphosphorylase [Bacteroidales bacterium]
MSQIISEALREDIGSGDHTSLSTIPGTARGKARLLVKEDGILAGVDVAREVFRQVDPDITITIFKHDGESIHKGDIVFEVEGRSVSLLTAERTVLNFMQRMSGIATQTHKLVLKLKGLKTRILDTRKTTPVLRELEKMAVKTGGGLNHRFGLFDMILIKDNHVDFAGGISKAIDAAHRYLDEKNLNLRIEIEVRNLDELQQVMERGGVDRIMLDNFDFETLRKAVQIIGGKYETEASGGITEETIRQYAECGVDFISVGALTHHISSLDLSLKAVK